MKSNRKWPVRLIAGGLVTLTLAGVALAAGTQGSQSDPLVTLSYLTEKPIPSILAQVDQKITQREEQLETQLSGVAEGYIQQMEDKQGGSGAVFTVVTLTQGQQLVGGAGCELLLRGGTGVCVSDTSPGLIDMTQGSTLANGSALSLNHLYLATVEGRGVLAQDTVTLLVRGSYTIK